MVASLKLVSPGGVTTPILSDFPGYPLSSVLLNSAAKIFSFQKIFIFIRVSPPGWCHQGRPHPSDATNITKVFVGLLKF